ncbi:TRAP transporter small permease [Limnohabitans radicicola]|uniref:TRAP transporter small permease protein n=1 Tax=Limnohabitans radicicola TaxID=2771427 RepID=A0A927FJ76_9BURK|nr:TRAP transporter small permease [Limnohabitans radicicola]MBD8050560.1 TRAP transporter small permease [Limnohabitans radicicola]
MLNTLINGYCKWLSWLIAASLAVMVVLVFGNVIMRYGFNSGITVSEELSRWLFVWMTFLGAIVAMKEGAHLGSDTLVSRMPLAIKKVFFVAGHGLMLFVCWLLFRGAWEQALINLETTSAVMETSMAIFYACGVVTAVSIALILVHNLWRMLTGQLSEAELIGVRESEEEPIDVPAPLK